MKKIMRWILVTFALLLCAQCSFAYSVSSISISPSGSLVPGNTVTVSFTIQFAESGDETFASSDTLDFYTDLESPSWTADLILNDISNPQPMQSKKNVYLTGWILAYDPDDVEENLDVTLTGTVPSVSSTTDKIVIRVQQLDSRNNVVTGSEIKETRTVVNTAEVQQDIANTRSDLDVFRTELDEKEALGVDISAAEQKYSAAQSAVNTAAAYSPAQYTSAISSIDNAKTLLSSGETLLDQAWADKEIADAGVPIANADAVIEWLKPNATSGDAKATLTEITTKREIAAGFISTANDEVYAGNYDRARQKAAEAFTKANETYTDALALKKDLSSGFQLKLPGGSSILIIAAVIIVVAAAVGYVIYRKRNQWDELG